MITVIGGTYLEQCLEPHYEQLYGSGMRACRAIKALDNEVKMEFHTFCAPYNAVNLSMFEDALKVKTYKYPVKDAITFHYEYPLKTPVIIPRPDLIEKSDEMVVTADHILYYGMMEGKAQVSGKKVVYDPQSPVCPVSFKQTLSQADELVVVINLNEARKVSGRTELDEIKEFFFKEEGCVALVVKMGAKGALVYPGAHAAPTVIPVYKTKSVWPIGSGDVFAAIFAYHWMETGLSFEEAAEKASFMTAIYCNSQNFRFEYAGDQEDIKAFPIKEFPSGQVYLAGPFFTFAQRLLIHEIRKQLSNFHLNVFSPLHDVGIGEPNSDVAKQDITGLENCQIVFAVLDGLDSGTLVEIGYALKMGIPVVAFVERESPEDLTMLIGTGCHIEKDLTTALYKCLWLLAENE